MHISFQLNYCGLSHKFSLAFNRKISLLYSLHYNFDIFCLGCFALYFLCMFYCVDYFYYMFKNLLHLLFSNYYFFSLFQSGVDVNKPNSYDQTALDIVRSFTTCHAEREMKHLLKGRSLFFSFKMIFKFNKLMRKNEQNKNHQI